MRNILITGGAGYIGSVLVEHLLSKGHRVTVIDNFLYNENSLATYCSNLRFNVEKCDVRALEKLRPLLAEADIIIPLAALVGAPLCEADPFNATSTNNSAILEMLKLLSKDQLVIMPTTNSAYGSGNLENYCDEQSPLNPLSRYAVDKVEVEQALMSRENSISLRLATVFGMSPRMRTDLLVNNFVYRALTDGYVLLYQGHFKRNYIHVSDVCRAFVHAIDSADRMAGEIYNVGLSEANVSKLELCELIKSRIPAFNYITDDYASDPDQRNYIVSNDKIEKTGFIPKTSLQMGIVELAKGLRTLKNIRYSNI